MTYTTEDRTDPRPEVRNGPTYVSTEKSSSAVWLIAGILVVAAIIGVMMLAPFDRTSARPARRRSPPSRTT